MAQTGVDGVNARARAIGNPWIFQQARALAAGRPLPPPPSLFEQREVIAEHYRLAEEVYGPRRVGSVMRKFGIKYAQLHPQATEVRDAFSARTSSGAVARCTSAVVCRGFASAILRVLSPICLTLGRIDVAFLLGRHVGAQGRRLMSLDSRLVNLRFWGRVTIPSHGEGIPSVFLFSGRVLRWAVQLMVCARGVLAGYWL